MAAFERHMYIGTVPTTATLNGAILSSSTSITLSSGTGFPDGSVGPFCVTIDQGTASEEKVLCSSRTGAVLTVAASGRGYDGTAATGHSSGAGVLHTISARDMDEANQAVFNTINRVTAAGDLLQGTSANVLERLGVGSTGQNLTVVSGKAAWAASASSVLTTTGDLLYASAANVLARLGIGSTNQVLGVTGGLPAWLASIQTLLTTTGDLLYASGANTPARLGIGSTGNVLTVSGGLPTWAAPAAAAVTATANATVATSETTTSTTYTDLATGGPAATLTIGASGKAIVMLTVQTTTANAPQQSMMGFAVSGASTVAAADASAAIMITDQAATLQTATAVIPIGSLTAGSNTFTAKYKIGTSGTATFANRNITVLAL